MAYHGVEFHLGPLGLGLRLRFRLEHASIVCPLRLGSFALHRSVRRRRSRPFVNNWNRRLANNNLITLLSARYLQSPPSRALNDRKPPRINPSMNPTPRMPLTNVSAIHRSQSTALASGPSPVALDLLEAARLACHGEVDVRRARWMQKVRESGVLGRRRRLTPDIGCFKPKSGVRRALPFLFKVRAGRAL